MLLTELQPRIRQHLRRLHKDISKEQSMLVRTRARQLLCRRLHQQVTKFEPGSENENLLAEVFDFLLNSCDGISRCREPMRFIFD